MHTTPDRAMNEGGRDIMETRPKECNLPPPTASARPVLSVLECGDSFAALSFLGVTQLMGFVHYWRLDL